MSESDDSRSTVSPVPADDSGEAAEKRGQAAGRARMRHATWFCQPWSDVAPLRVAGCASSGVMATKLPHVRTDKANPSPAPPAATPHTTSTMKILTKEEEDAHYRAVLRGGTMGGLGGLAGGLATAFVLQRRWPLFRHLTLPFKAFFVSSAGTFAAIIYADRYSRGFEASRHSELMEYKDATAKALAEAEANLTGWDKVKALGREYRYPIVTTSWVLSMAISLGMVNRNRYLTTAQKLVQARMYAQGLTLLVLVASAGFEVADARSGKGNYETVKVLDPKDPTHKHLIEKRIHHESYAGEDLWKDMVESEEKRLKARREAADAAAAKHGN